MKQYGYFLLFGCTLGLMTEVIFKLVAGLKPEAFPITLIAYPVIISGSYQASRLLDRMISSQFLADVLHYIGSGLFGFFVEWTLLGNGPGSNAFQFGIFCMWTTFCFGPRVLSRPDERLNSSRKMFWYAFWTASIIIASIVLLSDDPKVKVVVAVIGLSIANIVWTFWMLSLSWKSRKTARCS